MTTSTADSSHENNGIGYKVCALTIFILVACTFIFPSNALIPFDRKTVAALGATMCYLSREFIFKGTFDIIGSIDFEVLVLLASIMVINHVVVHLKEAKQIIKTLQIKMIEDPVKGFWMISFLSFALSPFLTNDGVCLLFVEIIIAAFQDIEHKSEQSTDDQDSQMKPLKLEQQDAVYFLLSLACSSNIGSALTYTGNPQNMIVGQEAISILSPIRFLGYMILPATVSWIITTVWILRCWLHNKAQCHSHFKVRSNDQDVGLLNADQAAAVIQLPPQEDIENKDVSIESTCHLRSTSQQLQVCVQSCEQPKILSPNKQLLLSPRKQRVIAREAMITKIVHVVSSPFPYMVVVLLLAMIVMIFINVMPIAGLVCTSAVVIVGVLVLGNLWQGKEVWSEEANGLHTPNIANSHQERIESINDFFDSLFASIDYSLLMIFLGTFIVVANVDSTGFPRQLWSAIVGRVPFKSVGSIASISVFILLASQLLGNVAVVQLARPNVQVLANNEKLLAWAIISFVSTVGGNLTITGSAANIIVAERAARLAPSSAIDFFKHYKVCFWVTLLCCTLGAVILTLIAKLDTNSI